MGAAHELVLYVHGNMTRVDKLDEAIRAPLPDDPIGQYFTRAFEDEDDLAGSAQAGGIAVYALHLRKHSTSAVVAHLTTLFENGPEAILIVTGDYIDGPAEVYRLGYQPVAGY